LLKISINVGEGYNDPTRFVECVVAAERYGFYAVWFGDHLVPWVHSQNKSAYVWSVMPSALGKTERIKVGPMVTSPIGGRYHPLIVGQASATLDNMYPGRFLLGVGSGEAINEANFFSGHWPRWRERIERLSEAVILIRRMWESEAEFTHQGKYFKAENFYLYTKPKTKIPIYFAAQGRKAARYAGVYGDHIVTINTPEVCRKVIFPVFEESARAVGRDPSGMEKTAEVMLHFADGDNGVEEIRKSGNAGFLAKGSFSETSPKKIQEMSITVSDEIIKNSYTIVSSPDDIIERIEEYLRSGATHVELVTHSFPEKIKLIGEKVLPYFREGEPD
jgi:coenzyme F420-dependent glucose-6-phosphate dehydrogenase